MSVCIECGVNPARPGKECTDCSEETPPTMAAPKFELPADVKEALDAAASKLRGYVDDARAEWDEGSATWQEGEGAEEATAWIDDLEELAEDIETVEPKP
jgi:hypothetical protein